MHSVYIQIGRFPREAATISLRRKKVNESANHRFHGSGPISGQYLDMKFFERYKMNGQKEFIQITDSRSFFEG